MADTLRGALTATQAADYLSVSERQFHNLRKRPGFPAGKMLGKRNVRWPVSALDAWVADQPDAQQAPEPAQLARGRVFRSGVEAAS